MFVTVNKTVTDSSTKISVPAKQMAELNLSERVLYTIVVGQRTAKAYLEPSYGTEVIVFPNTIFNELLLIRDAQLNIWVQDNHIHLGPVVGVFMSDVALERIQESKPPISVEELVKANQKGHCLLYFFSIPDGEWHEDKVKGCVFHPRYKKWKSFWMPFPDVVYDRGVGFRRENITRADDVLEALRSNPNTRFINNRAAYSKWGTYRALSNHPSMQQYLPETIVYRSFLDVEDMLKKHDLIFLKSFWGSHGTEVMAIERKSNNYELTLYENGLKVILAHNLEELKDAVQRFPKGRRCIVQQGIRLFRINDEPFDLRIQLNKNRYGKWKAISNQARISRNKSLITNYALGADLALYQDLYVQKPNMLPTNEKICQAAICIALYLEKEYGEQGEIGLDLAVDENGRIWMIEANSKPDKNPVPGLDDTEDIAPQFLKILEYAQYLTIKN